MSFAIMMTAFEALPSYIVWVLRLWILISSGFTEMSFWNHKGVVGITFGLIVMPFRVIRCHLPLLLAKVNLKPIQSHFNKSLFAFN